VYTPKGLLCRGKYWPLTRVSLELSCCPSPIQETFGSHFVLTCHSSWIARVDTPAGDGGSHSIITVVALSAIWGSHSGDWSLLSNGVWRRVIEVCRRCNGTYCLNHRRYHSPSWWRYYVLPKRRYIIAVTRCDLAENNLHAFITYIVYIRHIFRCC